MKFGQRHQACVQCEHTMKRGHLQAKEKGLRRSQTCQHFDLRLQASDTVKKITSCCLSHLWYFIMAEQGNRYKLKLKIHKRSSMADLSRQRKKFHQTQM